jgi:preprotein translocase subunit SecG
MPLFVVVIHVAVCIALILTVLLQTGKGADMGAAFGGGSSNTLFGATGASTFLSKMTTVVAVVFMLTSLILAYMTANRTNDSILEDQPVVQETQQGETAPAQPTTEAAPQAQPATEQTAPPATESTTPAGDTQQEEPPKSDP